jgi:radical SAM superfamily enzyme YgiQ (UPF0313 family)
LIVAGGAHPSAEPEATLENPALDAVAIGEGEDTLRELLDCQRARQPGSHLAGLVVRAEDGTPRRNAPRASIEDLDRLPMPAWDLTDPAAYATRRGMSLAGQRRYMSLTTSRGCPYRCTYCHDIHGKRFRSHSPRYVLAMIDRLRAEYDIHDFDITDDIWNFDGDRMMAICDGLIERGGIGFTCPNGVRADRMTVQQAEKMADAGCQYVAVAIETATPRLQKQIRKHLRFDKVQPIIDTFTRRDVFTSGFFMVGFPGESEPELRSTIDFAVSSKLHAAYFFVVTPFGGTEMHEQVVDGMGASAVALTGSGMYFRPQKNLSQVPDEQFYKLRRDAYLRFYIDPRRIYRIWRAHPRRQDLFQYFTTMFVRDTLRIEPGKLLSPLSRLRSRVSSGQRVRPLRTPPRAVVAEVPPVPPVPAKSRDGRRRLPLSVPLAGE